jgi:hypothetical protein
MDFLLGSCCLGLSVIRQVCACSPPRVNKKIELVVSAVPSDRGALSLLSESKRQINEYVSVTDVKIEIEISDVLQFRLVLHMSDSSAQHSDVFLITLCVRKRRALDALGLGSSQ